jgi:hypothetical protein
MLAPRQHTKATVCRPACQQAGFHARKRTPLCIWGQASINKLGYRLLEHSALRHRRHIIKLGSVQELGNAISGAAQAPAKRRQGVDVRQARERRQHTGQARLKSSRPTLRTL